MKVFCYFVEPASYTVDLASKIYHKNKIDYCFIRSQTLANAESTSDLFFLDKLSFFKRCIYIYTKFRTYNLIIINGYNNVPFIVTFLFNLFSLKKIYIAVESDTQLIVPDNLIKRIVKQFLLSFVFSRRYIYGFSGGTGSHKDLFKHYGMPDDRIFLMPMMVNNEKFYQKEKKFPNEFVFLYVGRLVKHKNVEVLIKIFIKYFSEKEAVLKIVGGGPEMEYLKKHYKSRKVLFLGTMFGKDLVSQFKSSSCLVLPSIFEPWGLVVNEALSAGLPVLISREVGAGYDLVMGKETGLIASDMSDFGDKMLQLYEDSSLLSEFSENASKLMHVKWNYDLYNESLKNAITKITDANETFN